MARSLTYASRQPPTGPMFHLLMLMNESKITLYTNPHVNPTFQNRTASSTCKTLRLHCTDKAVNSVQGNNSSLGAFAKHRVVTGLIMSVRPSVWNSASPIDWISVLYRTSLLLIRFLHTSILFRIGRNNTLDVSELYNGNRLRCVWGSNRDLKTVTIWTSHPLRAKYRK